MKWTILACVAVLCVSPAGGQTLPLPARATNAPAGSDLARILERMPQDQREAWIWSEVTSGNVPSWNRNFAQFSFSQTLSGTNYNVTLKALPDYLALGSDTDYFLCPMTPILAQRIADKLGCVLPTRKMVNLVWTNATVKLNPQPIPASDQMTTVPVFWDHNLLVRQQRDASTNTHPLGALVAGHKKDVIISAKIYTNFSTAAQKPVVIYGWHYTSGVPIQPLYNGHSETWADYSHGIRLFYGSAIINGRAIGITNVLTNPDTARLLHDEGTAEGSTNGIIPIPHYRRQPAGPVILIHPRRVSARAGSTLLLSALASGDGPIGYEWRLGNLTQQSSTEPTLSIAEVAPASAGLWRVVASNAVGMATSRVALVTVREPAFPVLMFEDFEEWPSINEWTTNWGAANGIADFTAHTWYDHSFEPSMIGGRTEIIPAAPTSLAGNHAARLSVNANDTTGATCAANLFSKAQFSNDFALHLDCWINYPGSALGLNSTGSTQHAVFGLNHSGSVAAWNTSASDGFWFAMSGEGGDSRDYRAYLGGLLASTELVGSVGGLAVSNQSATFFQNLFPADRFETAGAPGKQWVEVELRLTNNIITWSCDGVSVASRPNTSNYRSGAVMFGLADYFSSIANPARDSFVLVDNVWVEDLSGRTRIFEAQCKPDRFRMVFSAIPGRSYSVGRSSDLVGWSEVAVLTSTTGPLTFVDSPLSSRRFYRVEGPL